jgi:hypothetical protein
MTESTNNDNPMRDIVGRPELLNVRLSAGDAYMIQSWIQEALSALCPDNKVLRAAVANYKQAFDDAAREVLTPRPRDE